MIGRIYECKVQKSRHISHGDSVGGSASVSLKGALSNFRFQQHFSSTSSCLVGCLRGAIVLFFLWIY